MTKEETTKERLKGVETELRGFRELMGQREKTSNERHTEVVKRLDLIAQNGKGVAKIANITEAIVAHVNSCPNRLSNSLRESWKVIGAVVALATGLSFALREALQILDKFV